MSLVTIVIGLDRDRGFLNKCIQSVERQTYSDIELLVIKKPQSIAKNFNEGLRQAKGEFIKEVSEDDYLPPTSIEDLVNGMKNHPWVIAKAINFQGRDMARLTEEIPPLDRVNMVDMVERNVIHGGTVLYRTEIIREVGGMDETLWTAEEYDMHLKLMARGYMPGFVDKFVYYHRLWKGQKSRKLRDNRAEERAKQIIDIQNRYRNV